MLLMDIDKGYISLKEVYRNINACLHTLGLHFLYIRMDRSCRGLGWHVVIRTKEALLPAEQIAIELLCGSDPIRARLDLFRARTGIKYDGWSLLYEEKLQ